MFQVLFYLLKVWLLIGIADVIILRYKFGSRVTLRTAFIALTCWPYVAYRQIKDALK